MISKVCSWYMENVILKNQVVYNQRAIVELCDVQYALLSLRKEAEKSVVKAACWKYLTQEPSEDALNKCTLVAGLNTLYEERELFYTNISLGILTTKIYHRKRDKEDEWVIEVSLIMKEKQNKTWKNIQ